MGLIMKDFKVKKQRITNDNLERKRDLRKTVK